MILTNKQKLIALEYSLTDSKSVCEDTEVLGISDDEYRAPERTHAEVLQRFDEAIARLEAAG